MWGLGLPLAMIATVVPAYITAISSLKALIGIIMSLPITLSSLPLVSYHLKHRPRKYQLVFFYMLSCVPWLL
jgi:hypothetical protein